MIARLDERGFWMRDAARIATSGRPRRRGLPWTPAEDAHLLQRLREFEALGVASPVGAVARELERGIGAACTRLHALRAGIDLAQYLRTTRTHPRR